MPSQPRPLFDSSEALFAAAGGIVRHLRDAGHATLLAGGCVRDALLGRPLKDIDIATRATPDEVARLFPGETVAVGKSFGVVIVSRQGMAFEVATFRADGPYTDGRRPDSVRFTDASEDAKRRDFTINGLFYDPESGEVLDTVGGRADLSAGIVRAIGDPAARFREDHLRLLRAVRFTAVLGFHLDPRTAEAARQTAPLLASVSAERIGVEFTRMLCEAPRPSRMLDLLLDLRLLPVFLPEVAALQGVPQPPAYHPEGDVWTHTRLMLDAVAPPRDPLLAYAVLLHDVGKPPTCVFPEDGTPPAHLPRFPNHARVGAGLARAILIRLRRPTEWVEAVTAAIERHMTFSEVRNMRPSRLRRFMGASTFPLELELHRLDVACSHGKTDLLAFLETKRSEFESEPVLPDPWVRGRDLLALGIPEGPELGRWLRRAYDAQLDARFDDREALLDWVRAERADARPDGNPP